MSPLPTYTFLPWMRQGIANNIIEADNDSSVILRASVQVTLGPGGHRYRWQQPDRDNYPPGQPLRPRRHRGHREPRYRPG